MALPPRGSSMPIPTVNRPPRVADAIWIAAALLHRRFPRRSDFSLQEIVDAAQKEPLGQRNRATLYAHVTQHCVANLPPSTGKYRLLFATDQGRRRLFKPGDPYDRRRERGRTAPNAGDIPRRYVPLLEWYHTTFAGDEPDLRQQLKDDPILAMTGLGKDVWKDESADEYVRRLREEWD